MADSGEKLGITERRELSLRSSFDEGFAMMGQQVGSQDRLFHSFNLDDHVSRSNLLHSIDRFFDLGDLREHLAPYHSHTGHPSIDPELMVRMLIVGDCFDIRSERRLCEEIHLNLAYPR